MFCLRMLTCYVDLVEDDLTQEAKAEEELTNLLRPVVTTERLRELWQVSLFLRWNREGIRVRYGGGTKEFPASATLGVHRVDSGM